ncbi:hypothetical protein COY27_06265 [Candidatus Woesearchaeota archaeon CG_4_10_14_0_2_um_filter_33_13]|nr:MAG: hypothetical protein COY27_06265 [Candidatus Woesearchaeota archaeon CG_4_10_14_0_2_um_filter_33_13]
MGWIFGKKKVVPRVPFPEGRPFDEKSLQFPQFASSDKVIRPEQVKAAVGVNKQIVPEEEYAEDEPMQMPDVKSAPRLKSPLSPAPAVDNSFIKIETYRKILGEVEEMRKGMADLREASKNVDLSEYNEETHFIKMRRATKAVHDGLLQIDKTLFKGE